MLTRNQPAISTFLYDVRVENFIGHAINFFIIRLFGKLRDSIQRYFESKYQLNTFFVFILEHGSQLSLSGDNATEFYACCPISLCGLYSLVVTFY